MNFFSLNHLKGNTNDISEAKQQKIKEYLDMVNEGFTMVPQASIMNCKNAPHSMEYFNKIAIENHISRILNERN